MVLLTLTPVELLVAPQAKASITAGYAPSVLNMPPIALQPVLKLPSSLPYASFISPTAFVASNYYVSAASGPIAAGVVWGGDTIVATVPSGITLNITQAFGDTGSAYQISLQWGYLYYAILMPNFTAPALANFNPVWSASAEEVETGASGCLYVVPAQAFAFIINPFMPGGTGCGFLGNYWVPRPTPARLSEGRVTFVSPLVFAPVSNYWLLALEDPVAFYYSYANISELLGAPDGVLGGVGLGATDVPQLNSLYTLFLWGNHISTGFPIGAWSVNYPFVIGMGPNIEVYKTSSGSWVSMSSGVAFYPVEVSTPLVTQYL